MKIKDINVGSVERLTSNRVAANRYQSTAQSSSQPSRSDDVNFSSTARTVSQANEVVKNSPDVRAEKVGAIQEAIDSGRYDVGSTKVADAILRQVLQYRKNA
ncbi:MAG: flagellar biosynthesis anti-sigma factor FlgM [Magnetococcales bacterium]|nr:flagellar biosynthesis anti-sigma factor FlgM [Magnetococcales bacterium]